jgi:hypothetical protein
MNPPLVLSRDRVAELVDDTDQALRELRPENHVYVLVQPDPSRLEHLEIDRSGGFEDPFAEPPGERLAHESLLPELRKRAARRRGVQTQPPSESEPPGRTFLEDDHELEFGDRDSEAREETVQRATQIPAQDSCGAAETGVRKGRRSEGPVPWDSER